MIPIGEVYKFKSEIEEELTPKFYSAVMNSLGKPYPTRFGDAEYVFSITCFTDTLRLFVEDVIKSLKKFGTTPFPLIRGFGFGKTHSLILLWHIFTSDAELQDERLRKIIAENKEIIRQTFVLACDVTVRESPFKSFVETIFGSTKMEKDPDLLRVLIDLEDRYDRDDLLSPTKFVDFLIDFVNESKRRVQKTPRFLILIDELGYGTLKRVNEYIDSRKEDLIEDIRRLISFITTVAEELKDVGSSLAIVYAFAEQDLKSLNAMIKMYYSDEDLRTKLEGLKDLIETDLIERLMRHSGGIDKTVLHLNPNQNIEIAKFRVLKPISDTDKAKDSTASYIQNLLETFKIFEDQASLQNYIDEIKRFYPISPDLVYLLKKVHNSTEFPKTEYVRTVISLLKDATKNALVNEPNTPLIGVRFLSLTQSALQNILESFAQSDWFEILKDLETAIESSKNRKLAEHIAKLIVSKGTTSNILALIEGEPKYGTSHEDIQASIVSTFNPDEVSSALEEFPEILKELKIKSGRIIERTVNGKKLYLPSVVKHILALKESYVIEEKKKVDEIGVLRYIRESSIYPIFLKLTRSSNAMLEEYSKIKELRNLQLSEPTCVIVPPWDYSLYNEIESKGYDSTINHVVEILNQKLKNGEINRPPYLIVLIPNTSKMTDLIESLVNYRATLKFIDHLEEEKKIVKNYLDKVKEEILTKRKEEIVDEKKLEKQLAQNVQQQIREAMNSAKVEVLRHTRDVVANLLSLYEKPIIYKASEKKYGYSEHLLKKREEKIREIKSQIKSKEIEKYSNMVGEFFNSVIDLVGFEEKPSIVAQVLLNYLEKELSDTEREYINFEELLENLILGFYGTLPKTEDVARKAIESLNGRSIEYPDKIVRITVDKDEKKIKFEFEKREPKITLNVSVSPKRLNYSQGEVVKLNITVKNEGAKGLCFIRIERDGEIVQEFEIGELEPQESKDITFELKLPKDEGEYTYAVISAHDPTEVDDTKELKFIVRKRETIVTPPPTFVKEITINILDNNKDRILEFISNHEQAFESCKISMDSDDFDISIDVKSVTKDNLDILIRFILPLARRCNTTPKMTLKVKPGMLKEEDIGIEAEIR